MASFASDRRGAISLMGAVSFSALLACAALAVDLGSIFLETRRLQGVADLASIAAANDLTHAQAAADATVAANGLTGDPTAKVEIGSYVADSSVPTGQRFVVGGATPNAARVTLSAKAALFFGATLTGRSSVPITRVATAAQAQLASFSLGTRLASLNGGIANAALSALTGSQVSLSVMDYNALATANVDLLQYSQGLKTRLHLQGVTYDQVLQSDVSSGDALSELADELSSNGQDPAATAMRKLAAAAGQATSAHLDHLIDLGPYGEQDHVAATSGAGVEANALDMANAILTLAQQGRQVKLDLGATVPGLANSTVWLAIGERANNSPWLTVAQDGSKIIRTAQTRLYIDTKVAPSNLLAGLGVAQLDLPIVVEAAEAQAKVSAIDCSTSAVTLAVEPSVGSLSIGQIDTTKLNDFKTPLAISPATIVSVLLVSATGSSHTQLGGASWQYVAFSQSDISSGVLKTVYTNDVAQASVASLVGNLNLQVSVGALGLGVTKSAVTNALSQSLSGAAVSADSLVNALTGLLGIHIGEADVRVNGVRCHRAALVA